MSNIARKYYCRICDYTSGQKTHIDYHRGTDRHAAKCVELAERIKKDRTLYYKYVTELDIVEDDDKTMIELRKEIIDKLSSIYTSESKLEEYQQEYQQEYQTEVPIYLNHELTQFTLGKTEQTLNSIIERYLINSICVGPRK